MKKDSKKLAMMIIAKSKPKTDEPEKDTDTEATPLTTAAEEVMQAIDSGDAEMLKESLKAFVEMCSNSYED